MVISTARRKLLFGFFGDDRAAQRYTFIANKNSARASDQPLHFILTATAE
jgi:hypothetical protein